MNVFAVVNSEITIGNLLEALVIIASATAIWMKLNQDVVLMKQRMTSLEEWKLAVF